MAYCQCPNDVESSSSKQEPRTSDSLAMQKYIEPEEIWDSYFEIASPINQAFDHEWMKDTASKDAPLVGLYDSSGQGGPLLQHENDLNHIAEMETPSLFSTDVQHCVRARKQIKHQRSMASLVNRVSKR